MSKCLVPSAYFRQVIKSELVKRGVQRQAVGSHRLLLDCGHTLYIQGTLRVPRRTRCHFC